MSSKRCREVLPNRVGGPWAHYPSQTAELPGHFHRQLPGYARTPLVRLDDIAKELGVRAVYLKDESTRLGLPSFKILGASWGVFKAVTQKLRLPSDTDLETLKRAVAHHSISLYAATDGNYGRAVARMGSILSIPVEIRVPARTHPSTIALIRSEGAEVVVSDGNYDDAVLEAQKSARQKKGGILIQDFAFGDYQDIPQWIVDGYATMMLEIDDQIGDEKIDFVIVPVGVGSFAQAVCRHYMPRFEAAPKIVTVEPDTAACFYHSLNSGEIVFKPSSPTVMAGLDCGTVSSIAWPFLRDGVSAAVTVSDYEAHQASIFLKEQHGVSSGPCGAATLAALRRVESDRKLKANSTVLLLSTEGARDYEVPLSVGIDDAVTLAQTLVQIDSVNPTLVPTKGGGETAIARYIQAWLEHRGIENHWIEPIQGRPSIVGVVRGRGNGKSLMLNGHIDTVTVHGYEGDPLSGHIVDGKLYGRGAADMKAGVAAALVALAETAGFRLSGDVIFAGVADEEARSMGTEHVLQAGWRTDAAIVCEPTNLEIIHAHKGFVWLEVDIFGVAAHGSRPDLGIDAIIMAGYFLVALDKYATALKNRVSGSPVDPPSVHASIIKGGEEVSSYPALCSISIERRTVPGEDPETVERELRSILEQLEGDIADFKFDIRTTFSRPPFWISQNHHFVQAAADEISISLERQPVIRGEAFWADSALLSAQGIATLIWGPRGEGLHAKEEFVYTGSIATVAETLMYIAARYCRPNGTIQCSYHPR
ncbi:tryptophan synthase beta subunit-like PLP-dependent enzyme [Xylaria arbuscula]|nr:tryptophan synthase beta subunit-like PLP-dependent enzyme [Xylaria arbuscula]